MSISSSEFAQALIRRLCPRCAQGNEAVLVRGVWVHRFTDTVVVQKGSLHKRELEAGERLVTTEQLCRAGEVRQMLYEADHALPAGTCGRLVYDGDDPSGRVWFRVVQTACKAGEGEEAAS